MSESADNYSWFGPSQSEAQEAEADAEAGGVGEFTRLWRGFMTARVTLGLVLVLLQTTFYYLGNARNELLIAICCAYFVASLVVRFGTEPRSLGRSFDPRWLATVGVDTATFGTLQIIQGASINFAPLFALPVLLASVLGSLPLAMGTAAGVTLLLLGNATWQALLPVADTAALFAQAAVTGAGCFVIAFLTNQIASRLATEEQRSRSSQHAERMQRQVNELVIESLTDGILVVDKEGAVRAINPSARAMLGVADAVPASAFNLALEAGWRALWQLTQRSLARNTPGEEDIAVHHLGEGPRLLFARTRLTTARDAQPETLCVVFLQDQREVEARIRTEKLAGMGRMSAAVAHEIRNPLAAIAQANALLDEDITEPRHKQLTAMVEQNARRLGKIVDDVLNLSRVSHAGHQEAEQSLALNESVDRICRDWARQSGLQPLVVLQAVSTPLEVQFDNEHLRRVLVNLLDNAGRYASQRAGSIQVVTQSVGDQQIVMRVWSDGDPLDQSVEHHLFEPFFSSESRSSGLGLYICRELCAGHGANITYERSRKRIGDLHIEGNEFVVSFRAAAPVAAVEP